MSYLLANVLVASLFIMGALSTHLLNATERFLGHSFKTQHVDLQSDTPQQRVLFAATNVLLFCIAASVTVGAVENDLLGISNLAVALALYVFYIPMFASVLLFFTGVRTPGTLQSAFTQKSFAFILTFLSVTFVTSVTVPFLILLLVTLIT